MVPITCPSCAEQIGIPEEAPGRKVRCPLCEHVFEVNAEDSIPPALAFPVVHPRPAVAPPLPNKDGLQDLGPLSSKRAFARDVILEPDSESVYEQDRRLAALPRSRGQIRPPSEAVTSSAWLWIVAAVGGVFLSGVVVAVVVVFSQAAEREERARELKLAAEREERARELKFALWEKAKGDHEPTIPLQAKLDGLFSGKVTYDGNPPALVPDVRMQRNPGCIAGNALEMSEQTWLVDPKTKGVANVVISLKPPAGKYFDLAEADRKRTDVVIIDQPHCAFVPHVVALFPAYDDGKKMVRSGQVFQIRNSAVFPHNSKWDADGIQNDPFNRAIPPNGKFEVALNPQTEPLRIACSFHMWMNGYIWVFDNPYHAVTKEDGSFTIKNVPTGVPLTVTAWHEAKNRFITQKMTFKKGDNTLDLRIKK